jgi:phosphoribosylformylglycinamidine synthase
MGDTIQKPGSDAGVVRIHKTNKAIASSIDSSPEYCAAHPITGGKQIVCENWRNIISVGAQPLAITNCLNFGNPEKEKPMGEFVECVQGIMEACKYLEYPVVSGNVSFYNETNEKSIKPTPTIGGVGLIKNIEKMITMSLKKENSILLIIGKTYGHLEQSLFAREILGNKKGPPPEINLFNEKNNGNSILELIDKMFVLSCHDISVGGILINLAEMCIAGNLGANINVPKSLININEYFFGEDQSRYLIEIEEPNFETVTKILNKNSVFFEQIGITQKENLTLGKEFEISVNEMKKYNYRWFKRYI